MKISNILKVISFVILGNLLFVSNISANQTINDSDIYTLEYNNACNIALKEQSLKWSNKVTDALKKQIDWLVPKLKPKYSDQQLFAINKKIISVLSKKKSNTKLYNTYTYLLVSLESQIDKKLFTTDYIKTACALLTTPLKAESNTTLAYQMELLRLKKENELILKEAEINKEENNAIIDIIPENTKISPLYDPKITATDLVKNYMKDSELLKTVWKLELEQVKLNTIERININRSMTDKDLSTPFLNPIKEYVLPMSITVQFRDKKYDVSISKQENQRYQDLEDLIIKWQKERAEYWFVAMYWSGVMAYEAMEKQKALDVKINKSRIEQIYIIRKKWEMKNICIKPVVNWYALKDRDTFKQIWFKNDDEQAELINDYRMTWFNWYVLYCDYLMLYPELKIKMSELEKMSETEITKLYKEHSFVPTKENSKFIKVFLWQSDIVTSYDQAMWIHRSMLNMKEMHFLPVIMKKKWVTWDKIYEDIQIYTNPNLIF